jgi:sn-glycerol 3-phosphate transport system substrate-binding protein
MTSLRRITLSVVGIAALLSASVAASAKTSIDFYFPVPVQGALAREMTRLVKEFNDASPDVEVVAAYTGSYDDTRLKTQAAVEAGKPPAVTLMSANFVQEFVISGEIEAIDDLLTENGGDPKTFLDDFWPALRGNATANGKIYAVPFQNSTPILYINADQFKEVGLDPAKPPATWAELVAAAAKLTKRDGDKITRYGFEMPGSYDYLGWLTQAFTMSNGGQFFNVITPGEVYYDQPSTRGALQLLQDLVFTHKVMPEGVIDPNQVSTDFFAGKASMVLLSTGSLSFIRNGAKFPYTVAFVPRNLRNAVPIGGGSLIVFKGITPEQRKAAWKFVTYMTSPETLGSWSRFTGYFAPRKSSYDLPEMKSFVAEHPDALIAVKQLEYAQPWLSTYNVVAVRKAIEDQAQAVLSGKKQADEAVRDAQKNADEILRPYNEKIAHVSGL